MTRETEGEIKSPDQNILTVASSSVDQLLIRGEEI